jgi:hypothetical protein
VHHTAAAEALEKEMMAKNIAEFGSLFSPEMLQKIQNSQLQCGQDMLKKAEARHKDVLKTIEARQGQACTSHTQ